MFKEYFGLRWEFDHKEVDKIIEQYILEHKPGYVVSLDGNNLANAYNDEKHRKILNNSIVNNCDSKWVPRMVNRIYHTNYQNYCGADLFIDYIKKAKYRQFFLGSNRKVLDGLKKNLLQYDSNIAEMCFEELPFRRVEEFDYEGIAKMLNEDKPDIIWVSLGCPKQEQFMSRLLPYLDQGIMFGFGAIFNFYSGLDDAPKRAPQWMINLGFEWLYRLYSEPKKQLKRVGRYLMAIPKMYIDEKRKAQMQILNP